MASKYFTPAQLRVINRIGDILAPGDGVLPRFSETGSVEQIDRMVAYLPPSDIAGLKLLTNVLRFTPGFGIRLLLKVTMLDRYFPGSIAANLRKLDIGLRGIIFSLYYSFLDDPAGHGQRIKDGIGWDGAIRTKPEEPDEMPDLIQAANPLN
ncbi:MAG: hypothetical protein WAV28_10585, partial [Sedimentisphaerales bacterium]